jgi:hypothetical protein
MRLFPDYLRNRESRGVGWRILFFLKRKTDLFLLSGQGARDKVLVHMGIDGEENAMVITRWKY